MRSTLTLSKLASRHATNAVRAALASCSRPIAGRIASSSDCTPRLIRLTPAERYRASFAGSRLSGLLSTVISASAASAKRARSCDSTAPSSSPLSNDGVPPPKNTLWIRTREAHGAVATSSISRESARR